MTTFTTTVAEMFALPQFEGQTDVVVNVIYLVTGVDGENIANISFNQQYTIQQGEAFTPYSQLTEAQVISWVNPQTIIGMEERVQGQINTMINPPVLPTSQALPW